MKRALSVVLALVMIFGIFSAPLTLIFASSNTLRVTTSVLNVRDDVWGNWVGSAYNGEQYSFTDYKKDSSGDTWYAITYRGKKCWVHGDFVEIIASSSSDEPGKLSVTADLLNVRDKIWGKVVSQVEYGEVFSYTDFDKDSSGDTWYKIEKGWVHGDFVKIISTPAESSSPETPIGKITVNTEALRVRTSPWGDYITTIYEGETYNYYATQRANDDSMWYQIEVDGRKGFVHGWYITFSNADAPAQTPADTPTTPSVFEEPVIGKIEVTTSALNVRDDVWGSWISTIYEGEVYEYVASAKDSSGKTWYKIKIDSTTGWVHGDYVRVILTAPPVQEDDSGRPIIGTLNVTTSVLNVRDAVWGTWIGQTYNSDSHHYYSTAKDSSGSTWYEIGFGGGSGWVHGDYVCVTGLVESNENVVARANSVSNVYALEEFTLEVSLKDNDGNAIKGAADRIATVINGAERPRLISVGDFSEVSSGVYHTMAKISDAHQSVEFIFTLDGKSLGESAIVHSTASEFQERWLDQNVGVYMDLDGWYGYQCKDVLDYYANDMFGSYRSIVGPGDAKDLFHGPSDEYFIKITRESTGPNSIPKMGDVIIYGGGSGNPYGHLAVVISATETSIRVLEQNSNGSGSNPAEYSTRPYSGSSGEVIGWLRPRVEMIKNTN
ncbi:MAG: CHAP domain-containing protein [Tissierellia bacterium]|nr:CHAP domain-containing protein [Bacillota bacterium]NLL23186.1 CHAP domain-containing protein [Tissierellia bacterium]